MKLLIVTQVVDQNDPVLGFFHRWIEEFAKHYEQVHVICLREGTHALPENVTVHSLGKEAGKGKLTYIFRFYSYIWKLRKEYDAVFVHMNQIYVLLGWPLWKVFGKKVGLWYTHKSVTIRLRLATLLSNIVFTASKESFRIKTGKLHVMGHGIDTELFSINEHKVRGEHLLSVGRLNRTKRHDLAICAAAEAKRELRIIGDGSERENLESLADRCGAHVSFLGAKNQEELQSEYQSTYALIHASETGSLDKVILEALACGCPVVSTSALEDLPIVRVHADTASIVSALESLSVQGGVESSAFVRSNHSIEQLISRIRKLYEKNTP
ncbi:hypothetical protein COU16_00085 [Candidatus Kaiserbacteria bacterium CG10_big_fil_rev_8_21_14_0_10_47_16]|uniref:Glycosyl transferase family 1 domain-containing protein n=1 Tax=Candidatus Kaiserbacteria bacterium CG10_big_fil_rev_8_21_14_0_10_47_16 TaxID=1974608 RepID=A0A2H0UGH5_9BACT|nr:MAG: hypothetical protein COU16_00085 [Candidatus Kaiserbacteria bacterium CG10_big_fil_rev_8_21_14_0_10_47_16]